LEYPKSTVKGILVGILGGGVLVAGILVAPDLFASPKNSPRTMAGTKIRIKIIVKQDQNRKGCWPLTSANFWRKDRIIAAILNASMYI